MIRCDKNAVQRVLVIDDNPAIHEDYRKILAPRTVGSKLDNAKAALFGAAPRLEAVGPVFEIECCIQGETGVAAVERATTAGRPFAVAFVDMRMPPGMDGLQTIRKIWTIDPEMQIVICSAYSDYSHDQLTAALGVTDRLLILRKPFEPAEVSQLATALTEKWRVTRAARLKMEQLEGMVFERTNRLTHAALHDSLTGLGNRLFFNERLGLAIERKKRRPEYRFAVLFLDFDRFKAVNDSLGHDAGDELLKQISDRLRTALRPTDSVAGADESTAARLGGDEFVLLIDDLRESGDSVRVAERLLKTLAEPYRINGHLIYSSASIGVTTSDAGYDRAEEMIRDADNAMYHAKAAGKSRYVLFDHRMHAEVVARLELENDLRGALERREMVLHYQPVVLLTAGRVEGFEALLRWKHPSRGLVPPADFIPCCEETGMIIPVGEWVLEEACRQAVQWQSRHPGHEKLMMHVNVSARQLSAANLVPTVSRVITETGIAPECLALEITETVMITNFDSAVKVLRTLREMGVQIYMDDFGTGYSSLSCLHRLPLTGLKIDRSFIKSIGERRDYAAIVDAIVKLARNLGIELVAEGIEDADQVSLLMALDCELAQGYYFGRPAEADAAEAWLDAGRPAFVGAA